ncbi:hypothetical protein N0B31_11515 [Salinirubellus salinus]|uniref:Uncharacterized protein n=1 Tax=Salinirubellus salinus TaxID=1364945 RepID=A0A9E7R191_9EURY|nr:hypothetical protein [Salinirubellus salinus]UWM52780.1 hypothetical protein N0B31_11515 [Salinirubellus salinus]
MTPLDVFAVALLALGALGVLVSGAYAWQTTRAVRAPAFDTLASPTPGDCVRVEGTAHAGSNGPLESPLSEQSALAVQATVEERRLGVVPLPTWVQLARTSVAEPFQVRTPTADISLVAPTASLVLADGSVAEVVPGETPADALRSFERRHEVPSRTIWHRRPPVVSLLARALSLGTRRYREGVLEPGAEVLVMGRLVETDEGLGLDPTVVSDRSPGATLRRMARTAVIGLLASGAGFVLGLTLWLG